MASSAISRMLLIASLACLALRVASRKASWDPHSLAACHPSGTLHSPGGHSCSECCLPGHSYPQYRCSPPVTSSTRATLTVNDFEQGGDGGGPSECDNSYHDNSEHVVALSTGWYSGGSRCGHSITISANGRSVSAKVVDECDSVNGCDKEHAFEPPCDNNIVDASPSVWQALGISEDDDRYGEMSITWSLH